MSSGSIRQVWSDAELDEALATLHSGPGVRQDELARTRATLMRAAGEVDDELLPVSEPERPAKKRPGSWRWIAAAAAAALVPGGVVVATNIFVDNGQDTAAHATSVPSGDILRDLRGTDFSLREGQYRYVKKSVWTTQYGRNANTIYQMHEIVETWSPSNPRNLAKIRFTRTGEIRWLKGNYAKAQANGDTLPLSETDVKHGPGDLRPLPPSPSSATTTPTTTSKPTTPGALPKTTGNTQDRLRAENWAGPTAQFLSDLPTDPEKLLERLRFDGTNLPDGREPEPVNSASVVMDMAAAVLGAGHTFGKLREGLCRAMAKVPGITLTPDVTTNDGRKGISYSADFDGRRREIVIDPATATMIADRVIVTVPAADSQKRVPAGTVLFETTMTVAITDKSGDGP